MIAVRRNTFETNSSSTHCLCYEKSVELKSEDLEKLKEAYIIKPFTESEIVDYYDDSISEFRDKLRYFYTAYLQNSCNDTAFMRKLSEICPNVLFCDDFSDFRYIIEDLDWLFSETDCLTDDDIIKILLYGNIYFGDRDSERYMDKIDAISYDKKKYFSISFSG